MSINDVKVNRKSNLAVASTLQLTNPFRTPTFTLTRLAFSLTNMDVTATEKAPCVVTMNGTTVMKRCRGATRWILT